MYGHRRGKPAAKRENCSRLNSQVNGPCTSEPLESLRTPKEFNLSGPRTEAHANPVCVCFLNITPDLPN
jgi:hypothetical protein